MPLNHISQEHCVLFGLNFLPEQESTELKDQWDRCFYPRKAFLLDVSKAENTVAIARQLAETLQNNGITYMTHVPCIFVGFFDLRVEDASAQLELFSGSVRKIKHMLGCTNAANFQFGYVGCVMLENCQPIRDAVKAAMAFNQDQRAAGIIQSSQLLLVSDSWAKSQFNLWLPAVTLLDLLHRQEVPTNILPDPSGDNPSTLGFLGFSQYDDHKYTALTEKLAALQARSGSNGTGVFQTVLQNAVSARKARVMEQFSIDSTCQPQHPGVIVPDKKKHAAQKGKYQPYNDAANYTEDATNHSCRYLEQAIRAAMAISDAEADALLDSIIQQSHFHCDDPSREVVTKEDFAFTGSGSTTVPLFSRTYTEAGLGNAVESSLIAHRDAALERGQADVYAALWAAYRRKPAGFIQAQSSKAAQELTDIQNQLNNMVSAEDFYQGVNRPIARTFSDSNIPDAVSTNYMVLYGRAILSKLDGLTSDVTTYYVNDIGSGLPSLDDCPIKLVALTCLPYTEENLNKLIPEV